MNLIGNEIILKQIEIALKSAAKENRPIPHMLFTGAAGCGKTSSAKYISEITGNKFLSVACDSIKGRADLLPLVKELDHTGYDNQGHKLIKLGGKEPIRPTIVFIDEIHGLSPGAQEHLGILMEEWYVSIVSKESPESIVSKESHGSNPKEGKVRWSPQFTLVGATTNDGKLTKPFRDRFKLRFVYSPYSFEESIEIVIEHAKRLKIPIYDGAIKEIAKRGRGVPRILVSLLERCRDTANSISKGIITVETAVIAFYLAEIDDSGLTSADIRLLLALSESSTPVGVENLAIRLNESPKVLSESIEPYLIQRGLMTRSSTGRLLTKIGKDYLTKKGHLKLIEAEKLDIPKTFKRRL